MKAKLKLENGKEFVVDVSEETLKELEKPKKKTGYERVAKGDTFYYVYNSDLVCGRDSHERPYDELYAVANYSSDKTVAEHNARADTLKRKVRRFAVEHRETELDWDNVRQEKYFIDYDYTQEQLECCIADEDRNFGTIYFDSEKTAQAAIEKFKDELIWYFTEYKDSL